MNTSSMLFSKLRKVGDKTGDSDSSCTTKRTPNTKHVNFITLTVKLSQGESKRHKVPNCVCFTKRLQGRSCLHKARPRLLNINCPHSFQSCPTASIPWFYVAMINMKMKVLRTNSAQSSVIDTEESRHNQRKDQFVSLTLCFTTQQVDRQREYKTKGNETMAYHHGGGGGRKGLAQCQGHSEYHSGKTKNEKTKK